MAADPLTRRETWRALRRERRTARARRWAVVSRTMELGATAAVLVPAQMVAKTVAPRARTPVPALFHRLACSSLGLQPRVLGRMARGRGVLFVANHLGWADIPVLGSRLSASFVSKSEVNDWGVFGLMARLSDTIYVDRAARLSVGEQRDEILARLASGGRVILFAEGTSSDGRAVLPFKSSLFSTVAGSNHRIQPVTLAYTRVNGMPVTRALLPELAWLGDVDLKPHIADFMRLGKVTADILCHPTVRGTDFPDRKALAAHCHRAVADGYRRLMRGNPAPALAA